MNHSFTHFSRGGALMLITTLTTWASAQETGTNAPTPAPTPTPTALSTPTLGLVEPAAAAPIGPSNEPVIDTASTRRTLPNRPLLITGSILLGGSYGASAIAGSLSDRSADDKLFYPVVGPWMDLADRGCDERACSNERLNEVLLIGSGVGQGLGALGILLSVIIPEKTTRNWYLVGNNDLVIAPRLGTNMTGLSAFGRF